MEGRRDETRERDGMDRTDKTRQRGQTGQGQDRTGNRPGTAKPNSGTVLLPNEFKRQKGELAQRFGYIIPLSLSSQPFFHNFWNDKTKQKEKEKEERNNGKEETCIIFIRDDSQ